MLILGMRSQSLEGKLERNGKNTTSELKYVLESSRCNFERWFGVHAWKLFAARAIQTCMPFLLTFILESVVSFEPKFKFMFRCIYVFLGTRALQADHFWICLDKFYKLQQVCNQQIVRVLVLFPARISRVIVSWAATAVTHYYMLLQDFNQGNLA